MSDDFDKDLAVVEQIRRAHRSAKPKQENPAWMNCHHDCGVLLAFIDNLWAAYMAEIAPPTQTDACRQCGAREMAEGKCDCIRRKYQQ